MRVWEVIEAKSLVVVLLHLLVHLLLSNASFDVLSMLLLKGKFLLDFNLVELFHLILDSLILKPLLLDIIDSLLSLIQCIGLRLLHILLHVHASILTRGLIREKSALASVDLLLEEVFKGDLGKELIIFQ